MEREGVRARTTGSSSLPLVQRSKLPARGRGAGGSVVLHDRSAVLAADPQASAAIQRDLEGIVVERRPRNVVPNGAPILNGAVAAAFGNRHDSSFQPATLS